MVPALSFGIVFHLSAVGLSQTDDAALGRLLWGPVNKHQRHDAQADLPQRHHAGLAIVPARVRPHYGGSPFKACCLGQ